MVPLVRLERTLLSKLDFESSASTNSATGARKRRPLVRRTKHARQGGSPFWSPGPLIGLPHDDRATITAQRHKARRSTSQALCISLSVHRQSVRGSNPTADRENTVTTFSKQTSDFERQLLACSKVVGEALFPVLVKALAESLKVRWVLVGVTDADDPEKVRTIAVWDHGPQANFEYPLEGSPCQNVREQGACAYPGDICTLFPKDTLLQQMGAESYIGMPLRSSAGLTLGIIAALDEKPLEDIDRKKDIIEVFAARAASELERMQSASLTERLGRIVEDSVSEVYIFDGETYRFELVNRGARENIGYDMDELRQMTPWDIKPAFSREEFIEFVRPLKNGEVPHLLFETVHRRKDGSDYDVAVQLQYFAGLENVFYASINDITERKKAEAAQAHLAAIVSSSSEAIISKSLDGTVNSWNVGAAKLFGFEADEMIGGTIWKLIPPDRHDEENSILEQIRSGHEISNYETVRSCKDGTMLNVTVNVSPIRNADGQILGASTIAHDITARFQAQERERLLLAEVNHRAKNLLSLVQVIARQTASSDPVGFAKRFEERILALSASHDVLVQSNWRDVPLDELITSQLQHVGSGDAQRIRRTGDPLEVNAAAAQAIGMALHELATNAAKYGALSTRDGQVDISWSTTAEDRDIAEFSLCWTESGGPPVEAPTRKGFGSTVIERILKLRVNGEVSIDYHPKGLVCSIRCPLSMIVEREAKTEGIMPSSADPRVNSANSKRARVLIVEDEAILALQIAEILEEADFHVLGPVSSVQAALELLSRVRCDAAILDINLGHETSEPVAQRLEQDNVPFMTLSSFSAPERPSAFNGSRHLDKPVAPDTIIREVSALLDDPQSFSRSNSTPAN